jgi:hypothetical protein
MYTACPSLLSTMNTAKTQLTLQRVNEALCAEELQIVDLLVSSGRIFLTQTFLALCGNDLSN